MLEAIIDRCTGCGACFNTCPKGALEMTNNFEGFLYPVINREICTQCGACERACPLIQPNYSNEKKPVCYAIMADDSLRAQSSSGGAFSVMAHWVLEHKGYVCGAAFVDDWSVKHIIISDVKDLDLLRRSKYVQSDTNDCFARIRKLLRDQQLVLFTGTPCQVAGLKTYLKKDYDTLYTLDIVCHGVPSPKAFAQYLNETAKNESITSINFRDKNVGGWNHLTHTLKTENHSYSSSKDKNIYMRGFLPNLFLRSGCSCCSFNVFPRQGDMTIGDFWDVDAYKRTLNDNKGTTVALVNNDKGRYLFSQTNHLYNVKEKVPLHIAIRGNHCLHGSSTMHPHRNLFFERMDRMSFSENVEQSLLGHVDCMIMNFFWGDNKGAIWTAYALQRALAKLGFSSLCVDNPEHFAYIKSEGDELFRKKYLNVTPTCYTWSSLERLNLQTDSFIVGSDQVWRFPYTNYDLNYFLNFVEKGKRKIACSASFGISGFDEAPESYVDRIRLHLKDFDAISVREADAVDLCQHTFGVKAEHVLDPVFFLEESDWERFDIGSPYPEEPYLASYILDMTPAKRATVENTVERLKLRHVEISPHSRPEDWLMMIKYAQCIITDSFHGSAFAIIFGKPFISILNHDRGASRFHSLLDSFNLHSRGLSSAEQIPEHLDLLKSLDIVSVREKMGEYRQLGLDWIVAALRAPINENKLNPQQEALRRMYCLYDKKQRQSREKHKIYHFLKNVFLFNVDRILVRLPCKNLNRLGRLDLHIHWRHKEWIKANWKLSYKQVQRKVRHFIKRGDYLWTLKQYLIRKMR